MSERDVERNEIFRCLFHGYYDMFQSELKPSPLGIVGPGMVKWLAAGYAMLNTSLWESGRGKLEKIKMERGGCTKC